MPDKSKDGWDKLDVIGKLLIPAVLAVATYLLNQRQAESAHNQFYAQLMGQREQADSTLRKDMFKSILDTFVDQDKRHNDPHQSVVNLEILAYNFHDALDLAPLFRHVRQFVIEAKDDKDLATVERLAGVVVAKQVDALREPDKQNLNVGNVEIDKLHRDVGGTSKKDNALGFLTVVEKGCVTLTENHVARRRFVDAEVFQVDRSNREVEVHLSVSKQANGRCSDASAKNTLKPETEQDTHFSVGLFDFPMIDNLRLENDDRLAIVLTQFLDNGSNDEHPQATIQIVYFPGSRASLKEKPYYDKIVENMAR